MASSAPRWPSCAKLTSAHTACRVVSCLEPLLAGFDSVLCKNVLMALHMRASYVPVSGEIRVLEVGLGVVCSGLRR